MKVTVLKTIVHRGVEYGLKVPVRYPFVAESNLDKKIKSLSQKYRTPSKLQSETKKGYCSFKVYKNVSL